MIFLFADSLFVLKNIYFFDLSKSGTFHFYHSGHIRYFRYLNQFKNRANTKTIIKNYFILSSISQKVNILFKSLSQIIPMYDHFTPGNINCTPTHMVNRS